MHLATIRRDSSLPHAETLTKRAHPITAPSSSGAGWEPGAGAWPSYSPDSQAAVREAWTAPVKAIAILPYDVIVVAVPFALPKMYW